MALPSIAGRAIHVKFNPRPHNLSESTDILKILERYGQVDYFRQLQFEPTPARNSAVAIYRHREGAIKACRASPLRFRYGESSESAQEYGLHATDSDTSYKASNTTNSANPAHNGDRSTSNLDDWADAASKMTDSTPSKPSPKPSENPDQTNRQQERGREVHLQISESTLNHELYLKRQFYHRSWEPRIRTIKARDLEKRTPIANIGNIELHSGEVTPRMRKKLDENPKPLLPRLGLLWQESKAKAEREKERHA